MGRESREGSKEDGGVMKHFTAQNAPNSVWRPGSEGREEEGKGGGRGK